MRAKIDHAIDRMLDKVWDVTGPIAGRCPVCAFYRGFLLGIIIGAALALVHTVLR